MSRIQTCESLGTFSQDLPRSDIFFRHSDLSCNILQHQTFSSEIFQYTGENNPLSSKILEVKSDRFLQRMYGTLTGVSPDFLNKSDRITWRKCLTSPQLFSLRQLMIELDRTKTEKKRSATVVIFTY